ncbi:hypothetical protein NFI96_019572 [Prochilodus magdalenae]|nr:hypothetical protein NFI96_019572 [Prochilodus magdalenae]
MRALTSPELLTPPAAASSISNQDPHTRQTCVQYLQHNIARIRLNVKASKKSEPDRPIRDQSESTTSSENTDKCGRHFLFDQRWKNGIYYENNWTDGALMKPILPPVSRDYGVHQSHNLHRFTHRKQQINRITNLKSPNLQICTFGSCDEYDLPAVSSVLLTVTTPPISGRKSITSTESVKNRSRNYKKGRHLLAVGFNKTSQTYPDPVFGAPASFVQRIFEISSLQDETVRQEKMRNLKKNNRQET